MFLIPLLLSIGLDFSLPEFTPETYKGDYIVGSVSGNDFVVDSIPVDSMPSDGLSLSKASEGVRSIDSTQSDSFILQSLDRSLSSSTDYWEILLKNDYASITTDESITPSELSFCPRTLNGLSFYDVDYNDPGLRGAYISVSTGDIISIYPNVSASFYIGYVFSTSLEKDTSYVVSYGRFLPSSGVSVLTSPCDGYLLLSYDSSAPDDYYFTSSVNYINLYSLQEAVNNSMGDVDVNIESVNVNLDDLNDKLDDLSDELHIKLKAMLFVSLMAFVYPLAMAIVHNVVGGKKDV